MEVYPRPKATPIIILKSIGLTISMTLGFGVAFYAGYNTLPYLLAPVFFLEMACSPCFVLIRRYLRGQMFLGDQQNNIMGSFYWGCVMFCLSVVSSFVFGITGFGHIGGFVYREYALQFGLGSSLLAVFWSSVLVYDARYYWHLYQQALNSRLARPQIILPPPIIQYSK